VFMNLHTLPPGQHLYTVAVTDDPAALSYDEVDVVARAGATSDQVLAAADLAAYSGCRVVGVINQSDGYVLWQDPASTRAVGECPRCGGTEALAATGCLYEQEA
jgi:fructoselysine-6-P-deglycase FrlB-like protein